MGRYFSNESEERGTSSRAVGAEALGGEGWGLLGEGGGTRMRASGADGAAASAAAAAEAAGWLEDKRRRRELDAERSMGSASKTKNVDDDDSSKRRRRLFELRSRLETTNTQHTTGAHGNAAFHPSLFPPSCGQPKAGLTGPLVPNPSMQRLKQAHFKVSRHPGLAHRALARSSPQMRRESRRTYSFLQVCRYVAVL